MEFCEELPATIHGLLRGHEMNDNAAFCRVAFCTAGYPAYGRKGSI